jgi:hypothetical protein
MRSPFSQILLCCSSISRASLLLKSGVTTFVLFIEKKYHIIDNITI